MGLSAWEQQALDSIKSGIAGSDPELTALLSAFTQLASGEKMPDRADVSAGPPRFLRRIRHARWRCRLLRARQRMGFQKTALLSLWLLTTAALIAVVVILSTGGSQGDTCAGTAAIACADLTPGHISPDSPSDSTTSSSQAPQQHTGIVQAGP
jgi:hypothetical protein